MAKKRKRRHKLPVILTPAESAALLSAARAATNAARSPAKELCAWRDFAMISTGLLAGPRIAELCDLKVSDVDLGGAVLRIIAGKGDRDRNIPIGKKLLRVLSEWIGDRTQGFLFQGPNGKRLAHRTFQLRIAALARAAGITKAIHPHHLRHSFACALVHSGADIRNVMELMGHANLATTAIYLHVESEHLRGDVDRL